MAQELTISPDSEGITDAQDRLPATEHEELVGISEACHLTGLSARTVRYYEEVGLLPGVRRRSAGRRVYGPDELERLRFIQRLKTLGLSLAEIKDLNAVYAIAGSTADMLNRLDELLGRRLRELDTRIGELVSLRDDMTAYRQHVDSRIAHSDSAPPQGLPESQSGRDEE